MSAGRVTVIFTSVIGLHFSDVSGGHVRRQSTMASAWLASTAAVMLTLNSSRAYKCLCHSSHLIWSDLISSEVSVTVIAVAAANRNEVGCTLHFNWSQRR